MQDSIVVQICKNGKCFEKLKGNYQQDILYQSQALSFFTAITLLHTVGFFKFKDRHDMRRSKFSKLSDMQVGISKPICLS